MDVKTAIEHSRSAGDSEKNASSDDSLLQAVGAVEQAPPALFTRRMFRLYAILSLGYMCIVLQGYDGSLMGAINAMVSLLHT
jgi:hypothetical protein